MTHGNVVPPSGAESASSDLGVGQPYDISFLPRSFQVFRAVYGNAIDGYPSLSEGEQRLMILERTTPTTLAGIKDVFGRLINHALMGSQESADRLETMLPHIQELALLAGLEPPREQPVQADSQAENMKLNPTGINRDRVDYDLVPGL